MAQADVLEPVIDSFKETVVETLKDAVSDANNATADGVNATTEGKTPSTPEGMAIAYGSLVFMALLPIFLGSFRFVLYKWSFGQNYIDLNVSIL